MTGKAAARYVGQIISTGQNGFVKPDRSFRNIRNSAPVFKYH